MERGVPCAFALLMCGCLLRLPLCQSIEGNAQNFLDDKLKSAAENIYKFLLRIDRCFTFSFRHTLPVEVLFETTSSTVEKGMKIKNY